MCGIVGVLGLHEAAPMLVDALKRLEYRGYDSAGIATVRDGKLERRRATGKMVNLSDMLVHNSLAGKSGIGHTRWATHGEPNLTNTHPHRAGAVAVVHNGIIENFRELRAELADLGVSFETDTDTETVALLTIHFISQGLSPRDAVAATLPKLDGAFALCFLFEGEDDLMIAARKGSPLAIGHGVGEMFVGSDAIAQAAMTDQITYLEEGDWAVLTRNSLEVIDAAGNLANRELKKIEIDTAAIDKAGHKHFMAKEIAEQPTVLANVLGHYINKENNGLALPEGLDFSEFDRLVLVACGTGFYACMTAKYWFEQISGLPVEIDIASEYRYRKPPVGPRTCAIFVSQSGETADTLAALRHIADKAAKIVAVVNVPESSIARESDIIIPIRAGVEVGVASTKAFTNQLAVLACMALKAAQDRAVMGADELKNNLVSLRNLPGLINLAIAAESHYTPIAKRLAAADDVLFLGRGLMYPMALEGALKLKEISYIHAEGYAAGELKHGPIALVDKKTPVVVMAPRDALFEKTISNMQEVMARNGVVLLITDSAGAKSANDGVWGTLLMPDVDPVWAPILYAIPAQLLAYHTAMARGTDVDQPRNLAKSVTVE